MANILIMLPDLRPGGFEKIRVLLANEFSRQGHKVTIALMQRRGELLEALDGDVDVIDISSSRGRHAISAYARLLRNKRPDAILAGLWPLTVIAAVARLLSGHRCRLVLSEHNQLSKQYASWGMAHKLALRASLALGHRLGDVSVAVSKGVASDLAQLSRMSLATVRVIANPVRTPDTLRLGASIEVPKPRLAGNGLRIVTVGSLKPQKNQALLLKAFAKMASGETRLFIVGDGPLRNDLERLAKELGVDERVMFLGFCPSPVDIIESSDLFVLSSDYEGMPNVLLEALSVGTPVVSTDCPSGPAEILEDGRWGRLTPVGDAEALADAMSASLIEVHDIDALKRRAADFSPEKASQQYLEVLGVA